MKNKNIKVPEKNQIESFISKDEDSCPFRYVNDLSQRHMNDFSPFNFIHMASIDASSSTSVFPPSTGDNLSKNIISSTYESQMYSSEYHLSTLDQHLPPDSANTNCQTEELEYWRSLIHNVAHLLNSNNSDNQLDFENVSTTQNKVLPAINCIQPSEDIDCEYHNQNGPIQERTMLETTGEGEAFKGCKCGKTKCLKLYCDCFKKGYYCSELCSCQGCHNQINYEVEVMIALTQIESRNPSTFSPPALARHNKGCNCKRSGCNKRHCECYKAGIKCSINCRCVGCKNSFGERNNEDRSKTVFASDDTPLDQEIQRKATQVAGNGHSQERVRSNSGLQENDDDDEAGAVNYNASSCKC